ncbi:hypothetical protein M2281_002399 [Mesorhizobium soli]|uniref:hypothetical protein n=1 Tax=Pseudaminobacter soli (ex Li et al. 2025) TaxID=1295366 RepID=UPI0024736A37|nr:hypothetical protein [Mesorhizobium soli]MDH6231801.1 hypothetical protein [Mesorhizobium soli]
MRANRVGLDNLLISDMGLLANPAEALKLIRQARRGSRIGVGIVGVNVLLFLLSYKALPTTAEEDALNALLTLLAASSSSPTAKTCYGAAKSPGRETERTFAETAVGWLPLEGLSWGFRGVFALAVAAFSLCGLA